jgi:hypothetical protein
MSLLRRFSLTQILLAASVPILGYGLAFAYERGYTGRYGVPLWMTRVSLLQAVLASVTVAVLMAVTPLIARVLTDLASRWIARLVLAPAVGLAVALWAASETVWRMGRHLIIPVLLIAIFGGFAVHRIYHTIVRPLLGQGGSWLERLKRNALQVAPPRHPAALGWLSMRVRWTLAVLIVGILGAHWYGNYRSRHQRDFLVSSSAPTCVAVRQYSDRIVCAVADLTRRRVLPRLRLLPASDTKENLTVASLSPLRTPGDVASERKLFAPARPSVTTTTVYATHADPEVTQAGTPTASKHAAAAKHATSGKHHTTAKTSTSSKKKKKKKTSSTTRR